MTGAQWLGAAILLCVFGVLFAVTAAVGGTWYAAMVWGSSVLLAAAIWLGVRLLVG